MTAAAEGRMTRRNLFFPDPLYEDIERRAKEESTHRGRRVTVAEWIRVACEQKATREDELARRYAPR